VGTELSWNVVGQPSSEIYGVSGNDAKLLVINPIHGKRIFPRRAERANSINTAAEYRANKGSRFPSADARAGPIWI